MRDDNGENPDEPGKLPPRFTEAPEVWIGGHKISDPDTGRDEEAVERMKRHLLFQRLLNKRKKSKSE